MAAVEFFLAFANDEPGHRFLRELKSECRRIRGALKSARDRGWCRIEARERVTHAELVEVFAEYPVRVFHFGGHAESSLLRLEAEEGGPLPAHSEGLAKLLSGRHGLALVFLNACATDELAHKLLAAGVNAVIATSEAIADDVAAAMAQAFYERLAAGETLSAAFASADAATLSRYGSGAELYRGLDLAEDLAVDALPSPWKLHLRDGAEDMAHWNLPSATGDPLAHLPEPAGVGFPESPYRPLARFEREHARVFCGRAGSIRDLYEAIVTDERSLVLLSGVAGVGKSSLLEAGLIPRLQAEHQVHYIRRGEGGLLQSVREEPGLSFAGDPTPPEEGEDSGRLTIVVLDQVEEALTRPDGGGQRELDELVEGFLVPFLGPSGVHPHRNVLLGFRKEWSDDVAGTLARYRLPYNRERLGDLRREEVVEAIRGTPAMHREYALSFEEGFAEFVATSVHDANRNAPTGPILQILLAQLWQDSSPPPPGGPPRFTIDRYKQLSEGQTQLDAYVGRALAEVRNEHDAAPGLVLDILEHHTTPSRTARTRDLAELRDLYGAKGRLRSDVARLVIALKEHYLLAGDVVLERGPWRRDTLRGSETRLAHDTLAPIVRARFDRSDRQGQRARRLIEHHMRRKGRDPLGPQDLDVVKQGRRAMRELTEDEETLYKESREALRASTKLVKDLKRNLSRFRSYVVCAVACSLLIAAGMGWGLWEWRQENRDLRARHKIAEATDLPSWKAAEVLLGLGASLPEDEAGLRLALRVAALPSRYAVLPSPQGARVLDVCARDGDLFALETSLDGQGLSVRRCGVAGKVLGEASPRERVEQASFSRDGRLVVFVDKAGIAGVWEWTRPSQPLRPLPVGEVRYAALSWDGDWAVAGGGDVLWRCRLDDAGRCTKTVRFAPASSPTRAVVSSQGTIATLEGQAVRLYHEPAREPLVLEHDSAVLDVAFDHESSRVVTGAGSGARVWTCAGSLLARLGQELGIARSVAFSRDGKRVVTASGNRRNGKATVWSLGAQPRREVDLPGFGEVSGATFDGIGERVVTTDGSVVQAWAWGGLAPPTVFARHPGRVATLASYACQGQDWFLTAGEDGTVFFGPYGDAGRPLRRGHSGRVLGSAFAPDDSVYTAGEDGTVRVWSAAGKDLDTQDVREGHEAPLLSAAFALCRDPSQRRILTVDKAGTAILRDAQGRPLRVLARRVAPLRGASFSDDGARILIAGPEHEATVWSARDGALLAILEGHTQQLESARFDRSGDWVVTASRSTVRRWRLPDTLGAGPPAVVEPHGEPLARVTRLKHAEFGGKGANTVLIVSQRGSARVQHLDTGRGHELELGGVLLSAAFSPEGRRVALAGLQGRLRVWELDCGPDACRERSALVCEPREGIGGILGLVFDAQGKRLLSAYRDGRVQKWNLAEQPEPTPDELGVSGHLSAVNAVAVSAAGDRLLTAGEDGTVRVWTRSGDHYTSEILESRVTYAAFGPGGKLAVTTGRRGSLGLWKQDGRRGYVRAELPSPPGSARRPPSALAFAADRDLLVAAYGQKTAHVMDLSGEKPTLRSSLQHASRVERLVFVPGGRVLSACEGGTVWLWDATGQPRQLGKDMGDITALAGDPSGARVAAANGYGTVRVWSLADPSADLDLVHGDQVLAVSFAGDGDRILTACADGTARGWRAKDGAQLFCLEGHDGAVRKALFLGDGSRVVTADDEGVVRAWRVGWEDLLAQIRQARDGLLTGRR